MDWRESKENPVALTPWSFVHTSLGILLGTIARHFNPQLVLLFVFFHVLYETKDVLYSSSSLKNSIYDQLVFMIGLSIPFITNFNEQVLVLIAIGLLLILISPITSKEGKWTEPIKVWFTRG